MTHAILCENLTFSYTPTTPLFQFSVAVKKHAFALLVGKNGAGKSTFLSLVAGLLQPRSGQLFLNEVPIRHQPLPQRDLAILFHSYNLFPHLTVFENMGLALSPRLKLSTDEKKEIEGLVDELEMAPWLYEKAQTLSAGQQQRIGLGRCLLQKKSIMLLDEPFSAIDLPFQAKLLAWLREKTKQNPKTVLMVTHAPVGTDAGVDQRITLQEGQMAS